MSVTTTRSDSVLIERDSSSAEIALKGATVFSYKLNGVERLFTSSKSSTRLSDPAAIRGGIPICWPIFGPPDTAAYNGLYSKLKQHGFARTSRWEFADKLSGAADDGNVKAVFELRQSSATKELFDRDFTLRYTVTLLRASLHVSLSVIADSHGDVLPFQALLHSYLRLPSAVRPPQVRVKGFNALKLRDKLQGGAESNEDREIVTVDGPGGEVDRVYFGAPDTLEVTYEGAPGGMTVNKEALADAVLWNPGEKGNSIGDMEEGGPSRYFCLEPGQVGTFVELKAGQSWECEIELSFTD